MQAKKDDFLINNPQEQSFVKKEVPHQTDRNSHKTFGIDENIQSTKKNIEYTHTDAFETKNNIASSIQNFNESHLEPIVANDIDYKEEVLIENIYVETLDLKPDTKTLKKAAKKYKKLRITEKEDEEFKKKIVEVVLSEEEMIRLRESKRNHHNFKKIPFKCEIYSCPECSKKFASKVYWTNHYNFYHLQKSQYKCDICNKVFISDWRLKNHKQIHHGLSRSRDHACDLCTKKFYTLATLRSHRLTHSEQRSYMCEDCGHTFKQRAALYTHTRLLHRQT
ncbi:hypothetical protein HF086_015763 [Spodoptera exigua]|uniref:C2H2-type domain-containing protein n=1 Tax=Spodoptera exigua TaxID=7107 RepID=A0A922S970_SPOEX|nr:hypothetical protein HF086_015763 [Spodoptera exigua]